jgi:hypothetical protein
MERYEHMEYVIAALISATLIAGIAGANIYIISTAALLLISLFVLHYFKDYVDAFVFRHSNFIQLVGGYELGGERGTAVRKVGGKYIATACIAIEAGTESEGIDRDRMEGIIARASYPFKFTIAVERLDVDKMLDALQTKRSMKEIELSRIKNTKHGRGFERAMRVRRELEVIDHDIKSVSGGAVPMRVAYYAMVSATSERRFIAENEAKARAKALAGMLDGALGSRSTIVQGNRLAQVLAFDSTLMVIEDAH